MNIKTTLFDFEHHYSKQAGNSALGYYIFHGVTAHNSIIIDDIEYTAVYQNGAAYYCYTSPSNALELSSWGTSELLFLIESFYETDFDDDLKNAQDAVNEIQELCPTFDSVDKIYQVWQVLRDNRPSLSDFIDFDVYTDNIDDYVEDEIGHLTLKKIGE